MGKLLDDRMVEYAYPDRTVVEANKSLTDPESPFGAPVTKYRHTVTIFYTLLDENGVFIDTKHKTHHTGLTEEMESTVQVRNKINTATYEWVRQDKIDLSGFDMGAEV